MATNLTPTSAMQTAARRGLEWRRKFGRGGTAVGVARARDIANGKELSPETIGRMVSFFARHGGNRAEHFELVDGEPTPWRVAWELWGGDAGRRWAESKWKQLQAAKMKQKLFKINGVEVALGDLANAWLAKQAAAKEVEAAPPKGMIEKSWQLDIIEKQAERQVVYGVVLRANVPDSQGDVIKEDEIIDAAHTFMMTSRKADWQHREVLSHSKAVPVESFVAPVDFAMGGKQVKKGDWILGMKILDGEMWQAVKSGEMRGFSIKGIGRRRRIG